MSKKATLATFVNRTSPFNLTKKIIHTMALQYEWITEIIRHYFRMIKMSVDFSNIAATVSNALFSKSKGGAYGHIDDF
jgi:hypothetical protein